MLSSTFYFGVVQMSEDKLAVSILVAFREEVGKTSLSEQAQNAFAFSLRADTNHSYTLAYLGLWTIVHKEKSGVVFQIYKNPQEVNQELTEKLNGRIQQVLFAEVSA